SAIARATLTKQVLVDATSLEQTIAEFVPRDASLHVGELEGSQRPEHHTQAAAPLALSHGSEGLVGGGRVVGGEGAPPPARRGRAGGDDAKPPSRRPEAREVRHVAIVTLRLLPTSSDEAGVDGVEAVSAATPGLVRALERSRAMLGDMAYKHGM